MKKDNSVIKGEKNIPKRKFPLKSYRRPKKRKNENKNIANEEKNLKIQENVNKNLQKEENKNKVQTKNVQPSKKENVNATLKNNKSNKINDSKKSNTNNSKTANKTESKSNSGNKKIPSKSVTKNKNNGNGTVKHTDRQKIFLDEIDEGILLARKNTKEPKKIPSKKNIPEKKLKIIPLGGIAEIGKNMTLFEYGEEIVIVDAGLAFPDEDMLGIDLVIPDFTYVIQNAHKIKGLLITHGHEDHIGAVPYLLSSVDIPVYGTPLSLGIIEGKLDEHRIPFKPRLHTVEAGEIINLGSFKIEFVHVNHSIADACAIFIKTPAGTVFHTGDFKLDVSPIDGKMMDITRIGEIGKSGVDILLCESTNAERSGFTPSERTVGGSLDRIFMQSEGKRLIIATFSSNVHRVQQIIDTSAKYGRRVAVLGRSMTNIIGAALELGYMELPDDVLIDINDIKRYSPGEITLITTGSQGEPMSALYRIAFSEHDKVKLSSNDIVVLSSSAIPGNEKFVGKIVNALIRNGVKVVSDSIEGVHVSGHACREEIKLMTALLKPKYYMPIHGEYRHLYANKEIAEYMGIPSSNIFITDIGRVLELGRSGCAFASNVPSGKVLIDGSGVGDIGSVVLRDRKHLSEDGLVVIVVSVNIESALVFSGPDIVSRGFVYVKESGDLMEKTRMVANNALEKMFDKNVRDINQIKTAMRDDVSKFIFKETKRKPMILPIIMEV